MNKKFIEQTKAREMRKNGQSLNSIAKELKVSKGSVSLWVKDVVISEGNKEVLKGNSQSKVSIIKRIESRLKNEKYKRDIIQNSSFKQISNISDRELWIIGTMLYWAEGGKTQRMVRFSNGDPEMIKVMMEFFTRCCDVPKSKIKGYIQIHDHLDFVAAEKYWQDVSGIKPEQFYKTYRKKDGKSKRRTLPYGVLDLYIMDVKLFLKIQGWIEGVAFNVNKRR